MGGDCGTRGREFESWPQIKVIRFGLFGKILKALGNFLKTYLAFDKILNLLL